MTDKERIREKIEKDFVYYDRASIGNNSPDLVAKRNLCHDLLTYIDSLSEEPVSKDLEEEIEKYLDHNYYIDEEGIVCDRSHPRLEYCEDKFKKDAHHFANWQKEQMMKDAVEGLVICDEVLTRGYRDIVFKFPDNLQVGDKVKLIIVKED